MCHGHNFITVIGMAEAVQVQCEAGEVRRRTRVALIGHSYVRRMASRIKEESGWSNLRFTDSDKEAEVRCYHRGGATVRLTHDDRWINTHLQKALLFRPDIVYLHIGENDLRHVDAPQLGDQIVTLMS